jgi:hypothetical protein
MARISIATPSLKLSSRSLSFLSSKLLAVWERSCLTDLFHIPMITRAGNSPSDYFQV